MPEDLILQASVNFPYVKFLAEGKLLIHGRFLSDRLFYFFEPLHTWVEELTVANTEIDFDLEYLPSAAFNGIKEILRLIENNSKITHCRVNWHYDVDDEEHFEKGQILKERFTCMEFIFVGREDTMDICLN